jgi:hypothetical protein
MRKLRRLILLDLADFFEWVGKKLGKLADYLEK